MATCKCGTELELRKRTCAPCIKERKKEWVRAWRADNPEEVKAGTRRRHAATKKEHGVGAQTISRRRSIRNQLSYLVCTARKRSRGGSNRAKNGVFGKATPKPFSIASQDAHRLLASQDGKCAVTGIQMTHEKPSDTNVSIDCIVSRNGYVPGNIRLVCWRVNAMRCDMTDQTLFKWCRAIADSAPLKYDRPAAPPELALSEKEAIKAGLSRGRYRRLKRPRANFWNMLREAKRRHDVSLTVDDLVALHQRQSGRCAVTGTEMLNTMGNEWKDFSMSIDRIDGNAHYSVDNIRLVCYRVNVMRSNLTDEALRQWCRVILKGKWSPGRLDVVDVLL